MFNHLEKTIISIEQSEIFYIIMSLIEHSFLTSHFQK